MDLNLKGKTALVTGASSGLGASAAMSLALEGVELYINSRSEEKLIKTSKSIKEATGIDPQIIVADVTTDEDLDKIKKNITNIDILVSNS
jgi:3-oxoacyl-[acyl-carrier protein] reductase